MFKLLTRTILRSRTNNLKSSIKRVPSNRTFLSQAYYCNEIWEQRFNNPVIQKINVDELYNELDQKFQKTRTVSAVDVDIFCNAVKDDSYVDELLDLLHKLRLSADTCNTLQSTWHATVRNFVTFNKVKQLLDVVDDRLNYGLFLDNYETNLLLDVCWKNKDFASGARVASQMMLQEDFNHPLCSALSLLHCYNFLLNPVGWSIPQQPEEPEEEIKFRVNYLRNPYDDEHFDLKDPLKIVGKTLMAITKSRKDSVEKSFYLIGTILFGEKDKAKDLIAAYIKNNEKIFEQCLKLIPAEKLEDLTFKDLQTDSSDLQKLLENRVKSVLQSTIEKDIALQCEVYTKWEQERQEALQQQHQRLLRLQRLSKIEESQEHLKERETLLWFFENEEKIELEIEEKKAEVEAKTIQKKEIKSKTDENYVPPEIEKKFSTTK